MNILIDTNVVLDHALERHPFWEPAEDVMLLADKGVILHITANSIADIYYIMRKQAGDVEARDFLKRAFQFYEIIGVTGADCRAALALPMNDYEDALQAACARRAGCSCLVTRDAHHFAASPVPAVTPEQFLEEWENPHA